MKTTNYFRAFCTLLLLALYFNAWSQETTVTIVSPKADSTEGCIVGVLAEDSHSATWTVEDAFVMVQNYNNSSSIITFNYSEIRLYKKHDFTFTPNDGIAITKIKTTLTTEAYANSLAKADLTNCTFKQSGKEVVFTPQNKTQPVIITNNQSAAYISKIEVTFTKATNIDDEKIKASLSFDTKEAKAYLDSKEDFVPPTLSKNPQDLSNITFSSSEPEIASVDYQTGDILLKSEGTTIITASCPETNKHTAATASYTLNVIAKKPTITEVAIVAKKGNDWYAATTNIVNKRLTAIKVVVGNNKVEYDGSEDITWTWNETEGTLANRNGDVLSVQSVSSIDLSFNGGISSWRISANGIVVNGDECSRALLTNGSVFGNYATSNINKAGYSDISQLLPITVVKRETESVTTNSLGWATFAPSKNVEMPKQEDVHIYYIKANEADNTYAYTSDARSIITAGKTMAAGTGVLVKAAPETTIEFAVNTTCTDIVDANSMNNALIGVTEEKGLPYDQNRENAYIFTKNSEGTIGFHKWGSGTLAKGKCYLQLQEKTSAPQFIILSENDAASIIPTDFQRTTNSQNAPLYNLHGQKVTAAHKGIIIKNKRKVIRR